jgi:phosphatidate cytidylyltransferase
MGTAIGVGVAIGILALLCFKLGQVTTLLLATVVVSAAAIEAFAVLRRAGYQPATLLGLAGTVSIMLAVYKRGTEAYPLVLAMFVVFAFLWYLLGVVRARVTINVAVSFFAFFWVGGLGSFAALMLGLPRRQGIAVLLGAVLCTVAYDVGGLFFGGQMGSRPLMPEVSPNKTIEGLLGGMASAVVVGVFAGLVLHPWTPGKGFLLGLLVAVVAPLGDLAESLVKRDIGVKDMGAILPGHGGVLDRFDAMLFVLPAVYYLALLLHFNQFKP